MHPETQFCKDVDWTLSGWMRVLRDDEYCHSRRRIDYRSRYCEIEFCLTEGITRMRSILDTVDRHALSSIAIFITASIWQYNVHSMLASLRPVSISKAIYVAPPESSLSFQLFLTPHYTAEILIYLAMTLLTRNWTIFTALVWVITNLSVSSNETRKWARIKFKENAWGQWNLIPFIN